MTIGLLRTEPHLAEKTAELLPQREGRVDHDQKPAAAREIVRQQGCFSRRIGATRADFGHHVCSPAEWPTASSARSGVRCSRVSSSPVAAGRDRLARLAECLRRPAPRGPSASRHASSESAAGPSATDLAMSAHEADDIDLLFQDPQCRDRPSVRDRRCSRRRLADLRPAAALCCRLEPRTRAPSPAPCRGRLPGTGNVGSGAPRSSASPWPCGRSHPNDCRNRISETSVLSPSRTDSSCGGGVLAASRLRSRNTSWWNDRDVRQDRQRRWRRPRAAMLKSIARNREPGIRGGNRSAEREQQQHGGAPRRKEQDVRSPLVPMLRRAERAQDERGDGERQDWKPGECTRHCDSARRQRHASARTLRNKVSMAALR